MVEFLFFVVGIVTGISICGAVATRAMDRTIEAQEAHLEAQEDHIETLRADMHAKLHNALSGEPSARNVGDENG